LIHIFQLHGYDQKMEIPAATLLLLLSACQHNQGEYGKCGMVFSGFYFIIFKVYFLMSNIHFYAAFNLLFHHNLC